MHILITLACPEGRTATEEELDRAINYFLDNEELHEKGVG